MNIVLFLVEWIVSLVVLFFLIELLIYLFQKKTNRITAIVFSFVIAVLTAFIVSPYFITFFYPEFIYLPILLFFFIYFVMKDNTEA